MAIPSLMQKSFTDIYDEFLFACSHGDYLTVERFLHDNIIDHNDICKTIGQGNVSPIVIAIEHHHLEVIKILLDHLPYSDFREALLLAIYLDSTKIAQLIMEHDTFKCFYGTFADWQTDTVHTYDESHFAAIRPIHLAAQYNRTTILYDFLKRAGLNDGLRYSQLRLSTYRGLSSDVYLALVSQDPITSAFNLCHDLLKLIDNEPNLASEYLILFNQVSKFTARLLDHIQNQIELEVLLTIERLNSAIEHNQQEFIIHSNTQQRLTDIWYQNINQLRSNTLNKRFLISIYYILIYIPMYIAHFWIPFYFKDRYQWYFQQPAIQAIIHAVTYIIFLILVIISSIFKTSNISLKIEYPQIFNYYNRLLLTDVQSIYYQKPIVPYLKIIILIWMIGYVYRNISKMIQEKRCLQILELLLTILFILYIILFTIGIIQNHLQWEFIININNWKEFEKLHNESQISNKYFEIKKKLILNENSQLIDISIISECIFSLILVCCIINLSLFFLINEYFGPLLLSLIKMSQTIYRWFIFIFIFLFAYETSLLHLFSYYSNNKIYGFNNKINSTKLKRAGISRSFGNLKILTINIFFSLFGITKTELTQTYINLTDNLIDYEYLNFFTSNIGSIIYGSFALFARIILITMIIAYIKRLYNLNKQQVLNNWKFARAKYYMTFIFKDSYILPIPLNLIPTPRHIINIFQKKSTIKKFNQKKIYLRNLNNLSNEYKSTNDDDIMNCIVLRFLRKYHPYDISSLKRSRQIQYKEELSEIRQYILNEINILQQGNKHLNKHISTVFFELDKK